MSNARLIALQGVHNFRDFGGWTTGNGECVVRDALFRSGHMSRTTPADRARISALKLEVIADLRQPRERQNEPNALPNPAPQVIMETADGGHTEAPHLAFLRKGDLTKTSVRRYMVSAYKRIPVERHHQSMFAGVFRHLIDQKCTLIHCAAGKDRTGILAALILLAVGVEREQVFEDYLMTNQAVDIDALLPGIAARIANETGEQVAPEALRPMMGVEAAFLEATLAVIGPLDVYFQNVLGLEKKDISALRGALLR